MLGSLPADHSFFSPLPEASFLQLLLVLLRSHRHLRVDGFSMLPTLKPGDWVIYQPRQATDLLPSNGSVVVACLPRQPKLLIVKRISHRDPSGVYLLGDNLDISTDSRDFGPVQPEDILGNVESKLC